MNLDALLASEPIDRLAAIVTNWQRHQSPYEYEEPTKEIDLRTPPPPTPGHINRASRWLHKRTKLPLDVCQRLVEESIQLSKV